MSTYSIGDYLLDRLAELDVRHVFGVPGEFTLDLLDNVVAHPKLDWVGCTNELNAGYAADGYARLRGIGALMTTFGVGELSAINAITGSFAGHVPVVHVVGSPSTGSKTAQRIVHHSLGDGVFTHFLEMYRNVTCARAALTAGNATAEIDRVLVAVRDRKLPGYLLLPGDVAAAPAAAPTTPLPTVSDHTDAEALAGFTDAARNLIGAVADRSQVSVLAGLLVHGFQAVRQLHQLIQTGVPHSSSAWAKSVVDESNPAFVGIYAGAASAPAVRRAVEEAPVLIVAGVEITDLNSGFFTHRITRNRTIEVGADTASVGPDVFGPITIRAALHALTELVAALPTSDWLPALETSPAKVDVDQVLTHDTLWHRVAEFLRPGDIVLADHGTSFYGMATHGIPADVTFIGQPLWASIGYTLPALLGAALAEPRRRAILLIGDGAAQMTATEMSTVLRRGLTPIIVVVDNDGYTVEPAIHGPDQPYSDIAARKWTARPGPFSPDQNFGVHMPATDAELVAALRHAEQHPDRLSLIQAVPPRLDVPDLLNDIANVAATANRPEPSP